MLIYCRQQLDVEFIEKDSLFQREVPKPPIIGEPMRPKWVWMKNPHLYWIRYSFPDFYLFIYLFFHFHSSSSLCLHTLTSISQQISHILQAHILQAEMLKLSLKGTSAVPCSRLTQWHAAALELWRSFCEIRFVLYIKDRGRLAVTQFTERSHISDVLRNPRNYINFLLNDYSNN